MFSRGLKAIGRMILICLGFTAAMMILGIVIVLVIRWLGASPDLSDFERAYPVGYIFGPITAVGNIAIVGWRILKMFKDEWRLRKQT